MGIVRSWILFVVFFSLHSSSVSSQPAIVFGEAKDSALDTISLYEVSDPVTLKETVITKLIPGPEGKFKAPVELDRPKMVFFYKGIYKLYLYLEPGMQFSLIIPEIKEKSPWDELNPYFLHTPYQILSDGSKESVNQFIFYVERKYDSLLQVLDRDTSNYSSIQIMDSIYHFMDTVRVPEKTFLHDYVNARKALVLYYLNPSDLPKITRLLSSDNFLNPAFIDVFNSVFQRAFFTLNQTTHGDGILRMLTKEISMDTLQKKVSLSLGSPRGNFVDLVILKGMYDAFYAKDMEAKKCMDYLEKIKPRLRDSSLVHIAENIFQEIGLMLPGSPAPPFQLNDLNGMKKHLKDFLGKYIYLSFAYGNRYASQAEMFFYQRIRENFNDSLYIVSILADKDLEKAREFIQKRSIDATFLMLDEDRELLKKYKVKAFPSYYLIGNVVWSPAPLPSEKFELRFYQYLRRKGLIP